ncbi:hypothetical protein U1Q18_016858 [Sarracenia purpurea var. burkii]
MVEDRSHIGGIIDVIKVELAQFSSSTCTHIRRNGNKVAHELAKLAISIGEQRTWHEDIHSPLRSLVAAEAYPRHPCKGNEGPQLDDPLRATIYTLTAAYMIMGLPSGAAAMG